MDVVSGTCVGLAGAVAGLLQIVPLEGTSFAPGWSFDWNTAPSGALVAAAGGRAVARPAGPPTQARPVWQRGLLIGILAAHVVAAVFASAVDLADPFSNGLATADLLRAEGLEDTPLFGHREPPAATVALGLNRLLFSPSRGVYATHPDWGPDQRELPDAEVRCAARALARREGRDAVFVANRPLPAWAELRFIGAGTGAIVESEDSHVYRLMVAALATTAADARCPLPAP